MSDARLAKIVSSVLLAAAVAGGVACFLPWFFELRYLIGHLITVGVEG